MVKHDAGVSSTRIQPGLAKLSASRLLVVCSSGHLDTCNFLYEAVRDERSKGFAMPVAFAVELNPQQQTVGGRRTYLGSLFSNGSLWTAKVMSSELTRPVFPPSACYVPAKH